MYEHFMGVTGGSHQKRLERRERPAAIQFQCKLASMSGRRCEPIGADLDSEGGKKAEKGGKGQSTRKIMEEKLIKKR